MKELCIVSGKGGTGKTTVSAAFASLAKSNVMADCDVDAADLHLLLSPELRRRESFIGARTSRIDYREWCGKSGIDVVGDIPFDPAVTRALVARRSVAEFDCGPVSEAVARLWEAVFRSGPKGSCKGAPHG